MTKPTAGCPTCGTPLISTFEVKYKEWYCMKCEKYLEWLQARETDQTNYEELRELFDQGKRSL